MNNEKSSPKIFIIIIGLLLVSNIGTMLMLFAKKSSEEHRSMLRTYLKSTLGFDTDQLSAFDSIHADYLTTTQRLIKQMQAHKQTSLKNLGGAEFSDPALSTSSASAAADQDSIELNSLRHLRAIRSLCNSAQRAAFDTGFYKAMAKPPR